MRDDDDVDDDSQWVPVFSAHTPAEEVQKLADYHAARSVTALREQLVTGLKLTPAGCAALDARLVELIMRMHVRDLFARLH